MWQYQHQALANYRLLLPDLRGYGQSAFSFEQIFIEEQALDLRLLLDELGVSAVHLVGLSMGGEIIVEFARLFPQYVQSLVICASKPVGETAQGKERRMQLAKQINHIGMAAYATEAIAQYIHTDTYQAKGAVYNHLLAMMQQTKTQGAIASHKGRALRRDNAPFLKSIKVPTLVVAGEQDYFFSIADMEQLARTIPNAAFEVVPNSGHLPNMEQPAHFNRLLQQFYGSIN